MKGYNAILLVATVSIGLFYAVTSWASAHEDNSKRGDAGYAHHDNSSGRYNQYHDRWDWRGPHKGCNIKGKHHHKYHGGHGKPRGQLDCSSASASPMRLWPANHRLSDVHIRGLKTVDGRKPEVVVQCVYQDEPLNGIGDGNTSVDAKLGYGGQLKLRKERVRRRFGSGNGRVYHIDFLARDITAGESCEGTVAVEVPLRRWGKAKDDGRLYVTLDNGFDCGGSDNQAPVISSSPVTTASEFVPYQYHVIAEDPEGGTLGYRLLQAPNSMEISSDGVISWAPKHGDAGSYIIITEVNDGINQTEQKFTLIVSPRTNTPPQIVSIPELAATEEQAYVYQLVAQDDEGDAVGFALVSGPTGLTVSLSGLVHWTPDEGQAGEHTVVLEAIDALGVASQQTYNLLVAEKPNDSPEISSSPVTLVNENSLYQYPVLALDPEGDELTYRLTEAPPGLALAQNVLEWTTSFDDAGEYSVTVEVRDGAGASASQSFLLTVVDVNRPPIFTSMPDVLVSETELYQYVPATVDDDGDPVEISLSSSPEGMLINAEGIVVWRPGFDDAGLYDVALQASDGRGGTAFDEFSLVVNNTNRDPQITSEPLEVAAENSPYLYQVEANDDDEQQLFFGLLRSPIGMSVSDMGLVEWVPDFDSAGEVSVEVSVSDGEVTIFQQFFITVSQTNQLPVVEDQILTAVEDSASLIDLVAFDGDDDPLTYRITSPPTSGSASLSEGRVEYIPASNFFGTDRFSFVANDGSVDSEVATVTIVTTAVNDAPEFVFSPSLEGQESVAYSAVAKATDVEGDSISFVLEQSPVGMTIDSMSGAIDWIPGFDQAGENFVRLMVTDSAGASTSIEFSISVANTNRAPGAETLNLQVDEDQPLNIVLRGIDEDGDSIDYVIDKLPTSGVLNDLTPTVTYLPSEDFNGRDSFTYFVNDGELDSEIVSVFITVNPVNDLPHAENIDVSMFGDSSKDIQLLASDIDGDSLSFEIKNEPANGRVAINGSVAIYTPTAGFFGRDSFTYVANDMALVSPPAVVLINVSEPNNAPLISSEPGIVALEGEPYSYQVLANDADNDSVSFKLVTGPSGMGIDGLSGRLVWAEPRAGIYPVTVQASDPFLGLDEQSFDLFVSQALPAVTHLGQSFWFAFSPNLEGSGFASSYKVFVSSVSGANVTLAIPGISYAESHTLAPGVVRLIDLTSLAPVPSPRETEPVELGINVESDAPIMVHLLNTQNGTTDAALIYPTTALGQEYSVASIGSSSNNHGEFFSVVAVEDETVVTITPNVSYDDDAGQIFKSGVPFDRRLNRGEIFQVADVGIVFRSNGQPDDRTAYLNLSGSLVSADKKVAVFSGNKCTSLTGAGECDHLVEQLLPVDRWGARFWVAPFAQRTEQDVVRVYAREDHTLVYIGDVLANELMSGQYHEFDVAEAVGVVSNRPVQVFQYARSRDISSELVGGPSMLSIAPRDQFISQHILSTPPEDYDQNYANLIAPISAIETVTLDGVLLDSSIWTEFEEGGYAHASIAIGVGAHRIAAVEPIGVSVYGYQIDGSYAYQSGLGFHARATVVVASLIPEEEPAIAGDKICRTVQLSDPSGDPVSQHGISFSAVNSVTGTLTRLYDISDSDGQAKFCLSRGGVGTEAISISVDKGPRIDEEFEWLAYLDSENLAPVIESTPIVRAPLGGNYSYQVVASDPDGDDLSYQLSPDSMAFGLEVSPDGLVSWNLSRDELLREWPYSIELHAHDAVGNVATQRWNILLTQTNLPPEISIAPRSVATEGVSQTILATLSDPNYVFGDRSQANDSFIWELLGTANETDKLRQFGRAEVQVDSRASAEYPGYAADTDPFCYAPGSTLESLELLHRHHIERRRAIGVFGPLFDANRDGILSADDGAVAIAHGDSRGVYAIDLESGRELWSNEAARVDSIGVLMDIDLAVGDSQADAEYIHYSQNRLAVHNSDGSLRYQGPVIDTVFSNNYKKPLIPFDLESDGTFEFLYGPYVMNSAGNLIVELIPEGSSFVTGQAAIGEALPVDINRDGRYEFAFYDALYDASGSIMFKVNENPDRVNDASNTLNSMRYAFYQAANFDSDPEFELVVSASYPDNNFGYENRLILIDDDGLELWDLPASATGPILIEDFDLDGSPDIYLAATHSLYRADGSIIWSFSENTVRTRLAASLADVDGNGSLDILRYLNDDELLAHDGSTGEVLLSREATNKNSIVAAYDLVPPAFIDIDNDQQGELIMAGRLLDVYESLDQSWLPAANRQVFLGQSLASTQALGNWRDSSFLSFGATSSPAQHKVDERLMHRLTDIALRGLVVQADDGGGFRVEIEIANRGLARTPEGMTVGLYKDRILPENRVGTVTLPSIVGGYGTEVYTTTLANVDDLGSSVIARLDDNSALNECHTANNTVSANTTRLRVTDSGGLAAENAISVGAYRQSQRLEARAQPGEFEILVGELFERQISAEPATPIDEIRYFLNGAHLPGAVVDSKTGLFSWTPGADQLGVHTVFVNAQSVNADNFGSAIFTMRVVAPQQENLSPEITSIPDSVVSIYEVFEYAVIARDIEGDQLNFQLQQAPSGMTINALTGQVRWIPHPDQVGESNVAVKVIDITGNEVTQSFSVIVLENFAPEITSVPPRSACIGNLFAYQIFAVDADDDLLSFDLISSPPGMTLSSGGLIQWNTHGLDSGFYEVEIAVGDARAEVRQSFVIKLVGQGEGGSDDIRLSAQPKTVAFVGEVYRFFATGISEVPGEVSIALLNAPEGMTLTKDRPFTGFSQLDWLPDGITCQPPVTLQLIDSAGNVTQTTFTIDVYSEPKRLNRFQCSLDAEFCPTR